MKYVVLIYNNPATWEALPHAERACTEVLALPVHPDLTEAQQAHVAAAVREFYA